MAKSRPKAVGKVMHPATTPPKHSGTKQVKVFGGAPSLTGRADQNKAKSGGGKTPPSYGGGPTIEKRRGTPRVKGHGGGNENV